MILTYKVKHSRNFDESLSKAKEIALFAINNRDKLSSKNVKHLGLPSSISNQILRKYGRNKKCVSIKSVRLTVPGQSIKFLNKKIIVKCLDLELPFEKNFEKINQIEIGEFYATVSVTVKERPMFDPETILGIDRNATGHLVVGSIKETGKVIKLGKQCGHIRNKYKNIRRNFAKKRKFQVLKKCRRKESNIIRDLNHKISRDIISLAIKNKSLIRLEDLKGIRSCKSRKSFKSTLNNWPFYQFQMFLEYKAKLLGIAIEYVDPAYTSKCCSRCGEVGIRNGKNFKCLCGHVEHADVNAAFNIANAHKNIVQLQAERVVCNGRTGEPEQDRVSNAS